MKTPDVDHVGILVTDLEQSRANWAKVMDLPFSPIVRYRPQAWEVGGSKLSNSSHDLDLRQFIYFGTNPSIEIQQFVNNGTHESEVGEGGHHIGFTPVEDTASNRKTLEKLKLGIHSSVIFGNREVIQFTHKNDLDNVSTEWVELSEGHLDLKDDGSPLDLYSTGGTTPFDSKTMKAFHGTRPGSNIREVAIYVHDLDEAISKWSKISGRSFTTSESRIPVALSSGPGVVIRLVQNKNPDIRNGIFKLVVEVEDLMTKKIALERNKVPITLSTLHRLSIAPRFLNGVMIEFVDL